VAGMAAVEAAMVAAHFKAAEVARAADTDTSKQAGRYG